MCALSNKLFRSNEFQFVIINLDSLAIFIFEFGRELQKQHSVTGAAPSYK